MVVLASIHIGPWKTGTSAFQEVLRANRVTLRDLGCDIPPGHFFKEAHHEIPAWLTGNLSKLMFLCGYSPLDPSRDGLSRYLDYLVGQARGMGAHTLVFTSEDFAMLDSQGWMWLIANLKASGVSSIRVTWSPFCTNERLRSYMNQYARQGEHISERDLEALSYFVASLVPRTRDLLAELSRTSEVDVRAVHYSKSRPYMEELLAAVLGEGAGRAIKARHSVSANESLKPSDLAKLNEFNFFNVEGRAFDRSCPVYFTNDYPYQRERLQMHVELLLEVDRLVGQLDEMHQLVAHAAHVQRELDAVYASRTWRASAWWRRLRSRKLSSPRRSH